MQVKACFNEKSVEGNPKMQMNFELLLTPRASEKIIFLV